jgi:hypothetical protein
MSDLMPDDSWNLIWRCPAELLLKAYPCVLDFLSSRRLGSARNQLKKMRYKLYHLL